MTAPHSHSGVSPTDGANSSAGLPSESIRTVVTLVLVVHLFIAVVAAIGSSRAYSELVNRLVDRLVVQIYYPDLLRLRSFSYGLTYSQDIDYEGAAEVVLDWEAADETEPDRVATKKKLELFDPDEVKLPIRRHRYLSFVRNMSELAAAESSSPLQVEMPMAVSRALLAEAGMPDGRHRFRLWRIPTKRPAFANVQPTPPPTTIYEGNITVRGGDFEFTKADRGAASSPVVPQNSPPPDVAPPLGAPI